MAIDLFAPATPRRGWTIELWVLWIPVVRWSHRGSPKHEHGVWHPFPRRLDLIELPKPPVGGTGEYPPLPVPPPNIPYFL
jgi:hypothetical protein